MQTKATEGHHFAGSRANIPGICHPQRLLTRQFTAGPFKTHRAAEKWAESRGYDNFDLEEAGAKYIVRIYTDREPISRRSA